LGRPNGREGGAGLLIRSPGGRRRHHQCDPCFSEGGLQRVNLACRSFRCACRLCRFLVDGVATRGRVRRVGVIREAIAPSLSLCRHKVRCKILRYRPWSRGSALLAAWGAAAAAAELRLRCVSLFIRPLRRSAGRPASPAARHGSWLRRCWRTGAARRHGPTQDAGVRLSRWGGSEAWASLMRGASDRHSADAG